MSPNTETEKENEKTNLNWKSLFPQNSSLIWSFSGTLHCWEKQIQNLILRPAMTECTDRVSHEPLRIFGNGYATRSTRTSYVLLTRLNFYFSAFSTQHAWHSCRAEPISENLQGLVTRSIRVGITRHVLKFKVSFWNRPQTIINISISMPKTGIF